MKLCRFGAPGAEQPGVIDAAGRIRDLSGVVADIDAQVLSDDGLARLRAVDVEGLPFPQSARATASRSPVRANSSRSG